MNSLIKIAVISVIITGLSGFAYAGTAVQTGGAGDTVTFAGTKGLATLSFTPSGNTIINGTSTALTYDITSGCSKTDMSNGMEYGMSQDITGYYQKTQGAADAAPPATITPANWTLMGSSS
ncbi:hypothetical protein HRM2_27710 [Desulforapulum autotrophicum HRM2]|uniref:Uncharacterized protein n=1 Tax=Desulforapulum autotrophicum (strain ATCC 43914 / DSM 3382 / VKM B-1955 / HRM2) TaxID=177437 RepID=C0QJ48_DESAH|nr:hypothetical protein [Desulforapulum autotrophicum]ACN15861.1 hypothetical protein HRM2_27710 [Desulforapulum autotrophicum HRM2]